MQGEAGLLIDLLIFVVGFALGGTFVFFGIRGAMRKELSKPPLSDEEKDERARQLLAKVKSQVRRDDKNTAGARDEINNIFESIRARATSDEQRLSRMLGEVKERIGEAPFCIVDGEAFVHPELQRELSKPGNEALSEILVTMARTQPRAPE